MDDHHESALEDQLPVALDQAFARTLERMSLLEAAKQRSLTRRAARIRAKHGEKSAAFTVAAARAEARTAMITELRAESERVQVIEPECGPESCVVHGRVVDESGIGVEGLTVKAVNDRGLVLRERQTNKLGYFKFELHMGEQHTASPFLGQSRRMEARVRSQANKNEQQAEETVEAISLEVSGKGKGQMYRDTGAQFLTPGESLYREIVVPVL